MNKPLSSPQISIVILGASFVTGNLGVSALAWSSIKIIRTRWPGARIVLVGVSRNPGLAEIRMDGRDEALLTWPVRYCANLLASHHIARLWLAVALCRLFRLPRLRLAGNNSTLGELLRCTLVCDITGGDSFSDIYGLSRLFRGYLLKRTCQMTGKPFILLPQTYGPFKTALARRLARTILERTATIYSRDQEGIAVVEKLIGPSRKVKLCPDVAFIMEPVRPVTAHIARLEQLKATGQRLIGLNISGLLYHGGYTRDNMFGLACNYPELVREIISLFAGQANVQVLLVPHVLPDSDFAVEDDLVAAQHALQGLPPEFQSKVIVLERGYDQNETKYVIGLCDFFLGARMHATIAALSQGIPAVAMAYSSKFAGVFATAGVADCVLDLRTLTNDQVLHGIMTTYRRREELRAVLAKTVPELKNLLFHMFDGIHEPAALRDNQEVLPAFWR